MRGESGNLQRMKQIATELTVQHAVRHRLEEEQARGEAAAAAEETLDAAEERILARQRAELLGRLGPAGRDASLTGALAQKSEKEFFALIEARSERILVHFFHPEFAKCALLDAGLARVAHAHPETLFVRVNALEAPFLAQKLQVRVLPLMVFFRGGVARERVEGFEGFGGEKSFAQAALLRRLAGCGAVTLTDEEREELGLPEREESGSEDSDE